ncbi:hypothetical protein cypCar_00048489 [Cyprinus carpio]|nr:hypothetical protein cypCar_00048489 [Cyprinus carpio]
MIAALLYFVLFRSAVVEGALSPWAEGSASGGECSCEAFLPNSTFPIGELILLESTAVEINYKLEMEISKVEIYEVKLKVYVAKIMNLTVLIELMEDDPDSYSELHIEEVKIKIKQVEALIVELRASIQTTSAVLISIRKQVKLYEPLLNQHK